MAPAVKGVGTTIGKIPLAGSHSIRTFRKSSAVLTTIYVSDVGEGFLHLPLKTIILLTLKPLAQLKPHVFGK